MVLDRLKQVAQHVSGSAPPAHPFDPLIASEIEKVVALVVKEHGTLAFNAVTIWEPRKADMLAWLADPDHTPRPHRVADVVAIKKGGTVYDGLVDLTEEKIVKWESTEGVQPLVWVSIRAAMNSHLIGSRSQWKISKSLNILFGRIQRSSNSAK